MKSTNNYSGPQRFFHWIMAIIILAALIFGFSFSILEEGTAARNFALMIHKSLGITAGLLIFPRLIFRLISPAPLTPDEGFAQRFAVHGAHLTLYALMFFMPITGYILSAAGGYSLPWFGLLQWPRLLAQNPSLSELGEWLHQYGAWAMYVVVGLHLAAVCWHEFYKKDSVLKRMLPD